jgi:CHAT domain-containing protein
VQRRGAGRVIASSWPVDDASTARLMRALYAAFNPQDFAGFSVSGSQR